MRRRSFHPFWAWAAVFGGLFVFSVGAATAWAYFECLGSSDPNDYFQNPSDCAFVLGATAGVYASVFAISFPIALIGVIAISRKRAPVLAGAFSATPHVAWGIGNIFLAPITDFGVLFALFVGLAATTCVGAGCGWLYGRLTAGVN